MELKKFLLYLPFILCFVWIVLTLISVFFYGLDESRLEYEEALMFAETCAKGELKGTKICKTVNLNKKKGSWGMTLESLGKNGPEIFQTLMKPMTSVASPFTWLFLATIFILFPTSYYCFPQLLAHLLFSMRAQPKQPYYGYIDYSNKRD